MSTRRFRETFRNGLLALLLLTLPSDPARAAWPTSPIENLPIATGPNSALYPSSFADGDGGACFLWQDNVHVYLQRVTGVGVVDPAWPAGGRAVTIDPGDQRLAQGILDGAGGFIVTWFQFSGNVADIYAQRVTVSGDVDPAWPANGLPVCSAAGNQGSPVIVSDGSTGALIAWRDDRSGNGDIYVQHVLASGVADPAWPANGLAICSAIRSQQFPSIVPDGAGGAIVAWADYRSGDDPDVHAQHVLAGGTVDPGWPADGRAVCALANVQDQPALIPDGAGGAFVAWADNRFGGIYTQHDIYASHLLATGLIAPGWPADGVSVCAAALGQANPRLTADGAGGILVTWTDGRIAFGHPDIYAGRVLASGTVDPAWPVNGLAVCTAPQYQGFPQIVGDDTGAAIVAWADGRQVVQGFPMNDAFAQRILANGTVDPAWPVNGRMISGATNHQQDVTLVSDQNGGAILGWTDYRSGTSGVYAQRVGSDGQLGGEAFVDVPAPGQTTTFLALAAPAPNPATYSVAFRFLIPSAGPVRLELTDVNGRSVATLLEANLPAGEHVVRTTRGAGVKPGIYFARLTNGEASSVRKVVLL